MNPEKSITGLKKTSNTIVSNIDPTEYQISILP